MIVAFQTYSFSQNRSKLTRCRHQERRYLVLEVERIQCCEECSGVRNEQDNNGNRIVPAIGTPLCTASLTPLLLRLFCACVRPFFLQVFLRKLLRKNCSLAELFSERNDLYLLSLVFSRFLLPLQAQDSIDI
jgi:hypothetical protein